MGGIYALGRTSFGFGQLRSAKLMKRNVGQVEVATDIYGFLFNFYALGLYSGGKKAKIYI